MCVGETLSIRVVYRGKKNVYVLIVDYKMNSCIYTISMSCDKCLCYIHKVVVSSCREMSWGVNQESNRPLLHIKSTFSFQWESQWMFFYT